MCEILLFFGQSETLGYITRYIATAAEWPAV